MCFCGYTLPGNVHEKLLIYSPRDLFISFCGEEEGSAIFDVCFHCLLLFLTWWKAANNYLPAQIPNNFCYIVLVILWLQSWWQSWKNSLEQKGASLFISSLYKKLRLWVPKNVRTTAEGEMRTILFDASCLYNKSAIFSLLNFLKHHNFSWFSWRVLCKPKVGMNLWWYNNSLTALFHLHSIPPPHHSEFLLLCFQKTRHQDNTTQKGNTLAKYVLCKTKDMIKHNTRHTQLVGSW